MSNNIYVCYSCIKSNAIQQMGNFDEEVVLHQLESAGIKDVARIRRDGYQIRVTFDKFIKMYVTKVSNHTTTNYALCAIIN
jgi:myosin heavy subunit